MGVLKAVKLEDGDGQFGEDNLTKAQKIKREGFLDTIWQVSEEFEAIYLKDLPIQLFKRKG